MNIDPNYACYAVFDKKPKPQFERVELQSHAENGMSWIKNRNGVTILISDDLIFDDMKSAIEKCKQLEVAHDTKQ